MADVVTGNTELGATKQDLIAALVQRELAFAAKLMPYVTDVSTFAIPGSKSISFPKLSSFTVVNRTEGSQGDASALTATVDTMNLNVNAYIAWIIDATTKLQSNIKAELEYAKRAALAHGRYVDSQILAALLAGAHHFQNVGADVDVTYANLLDMQSRYMSNQGLPEQALWCMSVGQNKAILGLSQFQSAMNYGETIIRDGYVKQLLGMPVMIHSGLASKELYLFGKDGIAVGFQKAPAMNEQPANEYGVGAVRAAMDQLFGVKVLESGVSPAAAGKSPLILGLND